MKTTMRQILPLGALVLLLTLALTLPAAAASPAGDRCEVLEDGTEVCCSEEPAAELAEDQDPSLPQLSAPVNLEWGKHYPNRHRNLEDAQDKTVEEVPGIVTWTLGETSQNRYRLDYYLMTPEGDRRIHGTNWTLSESEIREGVVWEDSGFLHEVRETGDYYFTVCALGDGVSYRNSETVTSPVWHFEDPGVQLDVPAAPVLDQEPDRWGFRSAHYTLGDPEQVLIHMVRFYYAADPQAEPKSVGSSWSDNARGSTTLSDNNRRNGAGLYYATVQYLSRDATKNQCSPESLLSRPVYISDAYGEDLDRILESVDESSSPEALRAAVEGVRSLDTGKLAETMLTDRTGEGTAGQIRALEELAGITSSVDVAEEMAGIFDEAKVDMVGAGLNVDPGQSVTLNIGRPDEGSGVVPAMYENVVQFSMDLTDDETGASLTPEGGQLAVPVKLTLPIPENINPKFLVIMHRHADGSYEELNVVTDVLTSQGEDGRWYASFLVRSFSDFVMAELTELTAKRTGGGVEVTLAASAGGRDLKAAVAVYDGLGRQLGTALVSLGDDPLTVPVPCDPAAARTVRAMILGPAACIPAEQARSADVT